MVGGLGEQGIINETSKIVTIECDTGVKWIAITRRSKEELTFYQDAQEFTAKLTWKQSLKEWEGALQTSGELSEGKAPGPGSRKSMVSEGKCIWLLINTKEIYNNLCRKKKGSKIFTIWKFWKMMNKLYTTMANIK